jgi:alpha-tubulin suppressor-like RCC1 family protein
MTNPIVRNLQDASRTTLNVLAVFFAFPLMLMLAGCSNTISVQLGGVGTGSVSSNPQGISCGAGGTACSDTTSSGTPVVLTATASSGSVFAGWGGACAGSGVTCSFTLNSDTSAIAYFRTTQVSTGAYHTCGLKMDGTVKCWGRWNEGQLGRGTTNNSGGYNQVPVAITNLANVVAIATGAYHTCALLVDGTVQCWGRNTEAQAGGGGFNNFSAPTPVMLYGGSGLGIAAGGYHSCVLVNDGSVKCWGYNHDHEIADLPYDAIVPPAPIGNVGGAIAVTAGAYHSCALIAGGGVDCWGYNHDGETGSNPGWFNNVSIGAALQVDAATGAGVEGTTAQGGYHTCAILSSGGAISCWGYNGHGELGNGNTIGPQPTGTPVAVAGLPGPASRVAAGGYHTCAIVNGSILCWGANESAQLGRGTRGNDILAPGLVSSVLPSALSVDAGAYHTCAVFSGATDDVRCWGRNTEGEVGRNGTSFTDPVTSPMKLMDF